MVAGGASDVGEIPQAAPRPPRRRAIGPDPYKTKVFVPFVEEGTGLNTFVEVANHSAETQRFNIVALAADGSPVASLTSFVLGPRMLHKSSLRYMFPGTALSLDDLGRIKALAVRSHARLDGKLFVDVRVENDRTKDQWSYAQFTLATPRHRLSVPYLPPTDSDLVVTLAIANIHREAAVDVYFRRPDGSCVLLAESLWPSQTVQVSAGLGDATYGDVVAYRTGSQVSTQGGAAADAVDGTPVDAIAGTLLLASDEGYGYAATLSLDGESVDGASDFGREHFVPVDPLSKAGSLFLAAGTEEFAAYRNEGDVEQAVVARHYSEGGALVGERSVTVAPYEVALLDWDGLGLDRSLAGHVHVVADGPGSLQAFYRDEPDAVGRSFLAADPAPCELDRSKYFSVGMTVNSLKSGVYVLINPTDETITFGIALGTQAGGAWAPLESLSELVLGPRETYVVDLTEVVPPGMSGVLSTAVASQVSPWDSGLVAMLFPHTVRSDQRQTNVGMTSVLPANGWPVLRVGDVTVGLQQNLPRFVVGRDELTGFLVDYSGGGAIGADRFEFFVDGELAHVQQKYGSSSGTALANLSFETLGIHVVDVVGYMRDGNVVKDLEHEIVVDVYDDLQFIVNTIEWRDYLGNIIPPGDVSTRLEQNDTVRFDYDVTVPDPRIAFVSIILSQRADKTINTDCDQIRVPVVDSRLAGSVDIVLGDAGNYSLRLIPFDADRNSIDNGTAFPAYTWTGVPAEEPINVLDAYQIVHDDPESLAAILAQDGVTLFDNAVVGYDAILEFLVELTDGETGNSELDAENGALIAKTNNRLYLRMHNNNGSSSLYFQLPDERVERQVQEYFLGPAAATPARH